MKRREYSLTQTWTSDGYRTKRSTGSQEFLQNSGVCPYLKFSLSLGPRTPSPSSRCRNQSDAPRGARYERTGRLEESRTLVHVQAIGRAGKVPEPSSGIGGEMSVV